MAVWQVGSTDGWKTVDIYLSQLISEDSVLRPVNRLFTLSSETGKFPEFATRGGCHPVYNVTTFIVCMFDALGENQCYKIHIK